MSQLLPDDVYTARLERQDALCWCHASYGVACATDGGLDKLCASCRHSSPTKCRNAHQAQRAKHEARVREAGQ